MTAVVADTVGARPLEAFDLVDASTEATDLHVRAVKVVRADDPYLPGHFPTGAIYPGVFVIETVAQAARAALGDPSLRVAAVRQARFTSPLTDGDELVVDATVCRESMAGRFTVNARCQSSDGRSTGTVRLDLEDGATDDRPWSELFALLPHAHPMVLVDRVVKFEGSSISTVKAVTASEPCFADVAPGAPPTCWRYPASLLIESFGQTAALLWLASRGAQAGLLTMFATARDVQFPGDAYPGDILCHTARLEQASAGTALVSGETRVAGEVIARFGSLLAVVRDVSGLTNRPNVSTTKPVESEC